MIKISFTCKCIYTKSVSSKYMIRQTHSSKNKMGNKTTTFKADKPIATIFFMGVLLHIKLQWIHLCRSLLLCTYLEVKLKAQNSQKWVEVFQDKIKSSNLTCNQRPIYCIGRLWQSFLRELLQRFKMPPSENKNSHMLLRRIWQWNSCGVIDNF